MTPEEVIDFFAPPKSSVDAVITWLTEFGITANRIGQSVNKQVASTTLLGDLRVSTNNIAQWIQFDASVEEAESLLFADFFLWEHFSGSQDIAAEGYHIPVHIQEHIDYVTPGTRLRTSGAKTQSNINNKKRAVSLSERPDVSVLPGFPDPNSTTCSIYVTAECTRCEYSVIG
jgi:tripeptidyl-peptidase-1